MSKFTKVTLFEIAIFSKGKRRIHTATFHFPYCGANINEIRKSLYYSTIESIAQDICNKYNGHTWQFQYIAKRYITH